MMDVIGVSAAMLSILLGTPGTATLYDGASDRMPHETPWAWGLVGTGGTVVPPSGSQKTTLDTTGNIGFQEGWLNVSPLALAQNEKPLITFDLRVLTETHSSFDRAGISVIVICADKKGIELSFWTDRVWAQNDTPLFTHGEEAFVDTTAGGSGRAGLRRYGLRFVGATYQLSVDGQPLLSGRRRDYSAFQGFPDPYEIPNVLWVGDDTHSAMSRFEFSFCSASSVPSAPPGREIHR